MGTWYTYESNKDPLEGTGRIVLERDENGEPSRFLDRGTGQAAELSKEEYDRYSELYELKPAKKSQQVRPLPPGVPTGYDELDAEEAKSALDEASAASRAAIAAYESDNKKRSSVLKHADKLAEEESASVEETEPDSPLHAVVEGDSQTEERSDEG